MAYGSNRIIIIFYQNLDELRSEPHNDDDVKSGIW